MNKREKKEVGGILANLFESGGSDLLMEHYQGYSDCIPQEAAEALRENTELGEELEDYMNIELAKSFAKFAGGKFVMFKKFKK